GVDKRKDNRTINYRKRLCQRFDTTSSIKGNSSFYVKKQAFLREGTSVSTGRKLQNINFQ
ncbi:hypothetical protein, partial [uncultured Bacteroides sp.]|uniref:hypothetical protein n=1 Tax=uncultured Bacteroides sp. TaxID=162156 RepID=UPI0025988D0B